MDTRKTVLAAEHPDTLISMWNLAYTLKHQQRNVEAIALLKYCVQLQEQRFGPNSSVQYSSLVWPRNLAKALLWQPHIDTAHLDPRICSKNSHHQIIASEYPFHIQVNQNRVIQNRLLARFHLLLSPLRTPYSAVGTASYLLRIIMRLWHTAKFGIYNIYKLVYNCTICNIIREFLKLVMWAFKSCASIWEYKRRRSPVEYVTVSLGFIRSFLLSQREDKELWKLCFERINKMYMKSISGGFGIQAMMGALSNMRLWMTKV